MQKILFIHPSEDVQALFKSFLRKNNFDIVTSGRASSIFKLIQVFDPNVVLIYESLGQFNGEDVCREIKRISKLEHIHLIIISDKAETRDCLPQECDNIIRKPFTSEKLVQRISTNLAQA